MPDLPRKLWRVVSLRQFHGRELRHTAWFATEQAMENYIQGFEGRGVKLVSRGRYVLDQSCAIDCTDLPPGK